MEKFEGDFLKDKYWGNKEFREAADVSARRTKKREGDSVPNTPPERIENYLDRFSEIPDREDPEKRERGISAILRLVEKKYIVKAENITDEYIKNVLLGNEAELLGYEREDVKDEQIRKTVLDSLEKKIHSPLSTYRVPTELRESLESMIITDQKSRMKRWFDYLTGEEARHAPAALRYWAFAEMLKQGDYDPVRGEYNKRTNETVAIFPELDQQALALVFNEVERRRTGKASALSTGDDARQAELRGLLQNENFGKLYAFMQEHVRSLKLPTERLVITEGEWKLFPKDSSPSDLTAPLQGYQTKWCIAGEGHAASYLETSDVWVYFSKDADDENAIPRACIIDNKEQGITEVRGIVFNEEVKQHLDDYITPVVDEKLKEMEGGEKWADTMDDMKKLRELHFKHLQKEPLNKNDLTFLYEIDRPIQESGYGKDPRIAELRQGRNVEEDMLVIFECTRDEIARVPSQINENTKAYVGQLEPGIFQKLPEHLEHVYTSFPDKRIMKEDAERGGKSADQLISEIEAFDKISDHGKSMLKNREFVPGKNREKITLIRLTVADLGFKSGATTDQIYERAQILGLELCPADTGPNYRLKYRNQPLNELIYMGMKQVADSDGRQSVFGLERDDGLWLHGFWAVPGNGWHPDHKFVFRLRPPAERASKSES
ncbi:hypothetical protein L0Y69_02905 [bacterium]|nr:hypothetical protein [bacterium]